MATVKKVKKAQDGAKKFAALAPPYNKVTFADKIAGAKKKASKAEDGIKATKDSTNYYKAQANKAAYEMSGATSSPGMTAASNKIIKASKDQKRQAFKGKPGYDANGFPKAKLKAGGKIKKAQAGLGLKPSKPAGPIDPNGAWTKVQERTIAGKKAAKVPLKKDKQLGASKMKMGGKMSKKK